MDIKAGMNLYAKCDCMNNFRKGQMVTIDDIYNDGTALVDGVANIGIDIIKRFFSDSPIDPEEDYGLLEIENKHYDRMKKFLLWDIDGRDIEEQQVILKQTIQAATDIFNDIK